MINAIIRWSLENRFLVACGALLLAAWGVFAVRSIPIDALPDLSENQVIVYADWPGRSPQEVEDQLTYPLSTGLQGLAGVRSVRAASMFGFSTVTVIFDDAVDNYFARTRVLERLSAPSVALPEGVAPRIGPDATGLGWVYQYYLDVDPKKNVDMDLGKLRSLQDYLIRYELSAVPGVAEVAGIGGFVRQYQVEVDPERIRQFGLTLGTVMDAITSSNLNVGGKTVEENKMEFVVRGVGLISSAADIEQIVVTMANGVPVRIKDIAEVIIGGDFRRGALDIDGREVVGGIVVMRYGANAYEVIKQVKERIASISGSLPPGVTIKSFYDRSDLISRAIDTLKHALAEEVILVTLAHILFLWHFRSILIVTLPLPASILISFILMRQFGVQSHIMSLTGIAISIGVLVDAGIVMTENVIRHYELAEEKEGRLSRQRRLQIVLEASTQVGRPIFFAMAIILLAFVPVFALTGQEGKLFHPLAYAKTFAMIGATLLAITLVPVLCTVLVRGPFKREEDNALMRPMLAIYSRVLDSALLHRRLVIAGACVLLLSAFVVAFGVPAKSMWRRVGLGAVPDHLPGFGKEFMPALEEDSLLFMPVLLPSTSLTEVKRIMAWQDRVIKETPEVASVGGKLGRADSATDPAPIEMIETTIMLKPRNEWRPGVTKDTIVSELRDKLMQVPGYVPAFLQPIENRLLMLSTGIRAQVGVKILGNDLNALNEKAREIEQIVRNVRGATGVAASRLQGKPYVEIIPDRTAMAQYGVTLENVMRVVEAGLGGVQAGTTIQGRERWGIQVRFEKSRRDDIEEVASLPVPTMDGKQIPLGQLARVQRTLGPSEIQSENGRLRTFVQTNVSGRDLGGFVDEIRARIAKDVRLEPGMTVEYSGQYEQQIRAGRTLAFVLPVAVLIIFLLLVMTFRSVKEAAHVILAVPFALTGGVFLQAILGYNFSVAVWVGYIALFGTAIQTGVVMVVYLEETLAKRRADVQAIGREWTHTDFLGAVKDGALLRLRPKLMTVATVVASLMPIMWSSRAGAEVMKPLAAPVIGGMISSLLHILVVTPVIFAWLHEKEEATPKVP